MKPVRAGPKEGRLRTARGERPRSYVRTLGRRPALAAALLQATSLPFIVAATQIGVELGNLSAVTAAAIVSAGLLSVLIFPAVALSLLREPRDSGDDTLPSQRAGLGTKATMQIQRKPCLSRRNL